MTGGWDDSRPGDPERRLDGPPYSLRPAKPQQPPCKCSHIAATHGTDRNGRAVCWSAACGCIAYRPKETT